MQDRAAGNSRRSIRALLAARPTVAHLVEEKDGRQMVNDADPAEIKPGMRILVKPGEKIPLDGTVLTGSSQVDTSPLTGESVPVSVGAGKQVYAGTVNLEGAITVEVTSLFADSSVARILELVEQASANKAPSNASSPASPATTRPPWCSSRRWWRSSRRWPGTGRSTNGCTGRLSCWSSPAPARS